MTKTFQTEQEQFWAGEFATTTSNGTTAQPGFYGKNPDNLLSHG
ncbi:MAG: hypothetical protein ABJC04_01390 [Verrucomicrobiota bacterium]